MARYIDAEVLTDHMIERYSDLCEKHGDYDHYTTGYGDAIDAIEDAPTEDVAPKREVAIEIFAKIRKYFYEESWKLNNELSKAIQENDPIEKNALLALGSGLRVARQIVADCEAEFMAGANKSEILYGGPREGSKKHAEKEMEEWKKRGEQ